MASRRKSDPCGADNPTFDAVRVAVNDLAYLLSVLGGIWRTHGELLTGWYTRTMVLRLARQDESLNELQNELSFLKNHEKADLSHEQRERFRVALNSTYLLATRCKAAIPDELKSETRILRKVKEFVEARPPKPVEPSVILGNPADPPKVNGKVKSRLTPAQHASVKALLEAGKQGLTKDELDRKSGHGDTRKILKRLANKDPDWKEVIQFAGTTGMRYRIL
jgi:hypothetical protein